MVPTHLLLVQPLSQRAAAAAWREMPRGRENPNCPALGKAAVTEWVIWMILGSPRSWPSGSEPAAFLSQYSSFAACSQLITAFSSFIYTYLSLFICKYNFKMRSMLAKRFVLVCLLLGGWFVCFKREDTYLV